MVRISSANGRWTEAVKAAGVATILIVALTRLRHVDRPGVIRSAPGTWMKSRPRAGRQNRMFKRVIAGLLLIGAPLIASAAGEPQAAVKPSICLARNSEAATVAQIAANPQKYEGRCVAVQGVMHRMYVYESVDGVYVQPRDGLNPASNGLTLGLDNIGGRFSEQYRHVSIAGRVQDCESGDRDRLAGLHFRDVGLDWKEDEEALLRFLLRSRTSPFSSIRTGEGAPQQIILVGKAISAAEPDASVGQSDREDYSSVVCFCREKSCDGRWPIAGFDADNLPSRPYACTQVGPYLDGKRLVPHFTTPIGKGGLAEPRAP